MIWDYWKRVILYTKNIMVLMYHGKEMYLNKNKPPSHHIEMMHFLPDEFEHFRWLLELGLHETILMLYDDGNTLRHSYFKHYGIKE